MKILVLSFYYSPDLSAGSFRTTAFVDRLAQEDVEIEVFTTMPNRYSSFKSSAQSFEEKENVSIYRLELPSHKSGMMDQVLSFFSYYSQVLKLIKNRKYDVVYATSSRLFTAFLGVKVSRRKHIPVYLDIRDIFVDTLSDVLSFNKFLLLRPVLNFVESYTFNNADHINLVSPGFASYFRSKFRCDSYSFFTNGIDDQFLKFKFCSLKSRSKKKVLYAGNIGEGQGLHKILPPLARSLNNYEFVVIGDGGKKTDLVTASKGVNNIKILPPVERKALIDEYIDSDILFLHLNDFDAFKKVLPSKLFEYAATGKPILAGVSGYAADFCSKEVENSAVFSPNDVDDAVACIDKLSLECVDRNSFISMYRRKQIMSKLTSSVLKCGDK